MATVVVVPVLLIPFSWLLADANFSDATWTYWFRSYACLPGLLPALVLLDFSAGTKWLMWVAAFVTTVEFLVVVTIGRRGWLPLLVAAVLLFLLTVVASLASRGAYLAEGPGALGITIELV